MGVQANLSQVNAVRVGARAQERVRVRARAFSCACVRACASAGACAAALRRACLRANGSCVCLNCAREGFSFLGEAGPSVLSRSLVMIGTASGKLAWVCRVQLLNYLVVRTYHLTPVHMQCMCMCMRYACVLSV